MQALRHRIAATVPTRDTIGSHRWLRPFARRVMAPVLWRFTRRSVPRGVALGMLTGILIPLGQIPAAALLALPLRANIPAAALTTLITNPVTTPPLWVGAYWLGHRMLDFGAGSSASGPASRDWLGWLFQDAGPSTLLGLGCIALALASAGYLVAAVGWRWRTGRKWRRRGAIRASAPFD